MTILGSLLVGALFACAVYLLLSRALVRVVLGLFLLGHAVNLVVFFASGVRRGAPPLDRSGHAARLRPPAPPILSPRRWSSRRS